MQSEAEEITLAVPEQHPPERLDRFLSTRLASHGLSRSRIQALLEDNLITVNGSPARARLPVAPGMKITINLPPTAPAEAEPEDIPLHILHEDADIIVIDKPHGIVVHPATGNPGGTIVNALLHHCHGSLSGIGGVGRPGIVHRLDKDTSGCLVAAKHDLAHRNLVSQFSSRSASKLYLTVIEGVPTKASGSITTQIARDRHNRLRMAVVQPPRGKEAITEYEVVAEYGECTLVRCRILTGRTHQIRVHMRHLGHPILGDPIYSRPGRQPVAMKRLMLHAHRLEIDHPGTGRRIAFEAPVPAEFDPWILEDQLPR